MTARLRTPSVRAMLIGIALVGVVYVLSLGVEVAIVIRPAADVLQEKAGDLLKVNDALRLRLTEMSGTLRAIRLTNTDLRESNRALESADAKRLAALIQARLDSVVAMRASLQMVQVPGEMRQLLALAVETETAAGLSMLDAVRELRFKRLAVGDSVLDAADGLVDSTQLLLQSAQGIAIADVLRREAGLQLRLRDLANWAVGWGVLGVLLLLTAARVVGDRLYRPITELEAALARLATGDLATVVPVRRADELGRLAAHFNSTTAILRLRAAEQLRRQENQAERFGRILDESFNEIYLFDATTLRFLQANRGALNGLGYSASELALLTPLDVLHEDSRPGFEAALATLRRGDQPRILLSTAQLRKDGSVYPVEVTLQYSTVDDPPVFVAVAEDVSSRSRVRELNDRLRRFGLTEQQLLGHGGQTPALQALTEMACEALLVTRSVVWQLRPDRLTCLDRFDRRTGLHDHGGVVLRSEQATYFTAVEQGEVIAAPEARTDPRLRDLVDSSPERRLVTSALDVPIRTAGRVAAVMSFQHTGAPRHWSAEEQSFAVSVADLAAVAIEAGDRSRLQDQLAQAQKMESIGLLAGGVAHDFNNLLTAILGYLDLVRMAVPAGDPAQADLQEIEKAARRATELTNQLLTFSRHQVVEPRVIDPNALVRDADKLLRRLIGEDIELVTLLDPNLGSARVDPGQFTQVIVNLAVNARDAMPGGGRLTLETRNVSIDNEIAPSHAGAPTGDFVEIAVSDTGHGMDRETLARLFEPFFTTKAPGHGTGLGLAICYGIVRQAGGGIWAYSEPGRGTTFKIHLPRTRAVPEPEPAVVPADPGAGATETVLLVEDEMQIRELATRVLKGRGYQVITAGSAEEGLTLAEAHTGVIDLLVSDVVLPRLNGRELAAQLRLKRPNLPVLYMSGYTRGVVSEQDLREEGALFLSKPFTTVELLLRVRELLDRKGRRSDQWPAISG
ncbi:MAG: ATP-binding protein [Gemmatimonadota bacterium]